ncbi:ATP-binding protein [Frankia tisae]|uniref:ATP-binding protein n=1 Tax=Frankia tisae TaxID=2950104 RepID=UPI0021BFA908|nr:ATP-binding protein [Frankia tisae]
MRGVVTCRRASRITLPTGAVTVPQLQRHVWSMLREWRLSPLVDVIELATRDSLIAHAVQVSRGSATTPASNSPGKDPPPVVLRLSILGQVVLAEVWDHTPTPPALADPDPTTEHGRGLRLIEALADRWSFDLTCPAGKAAWCVFRTVSQPTHRPGAMNPATEAPPIRSPRAGSGAAGQVPFVDEPALLQRVVDGLRTLDGRHLPGDRAVAPPGVERRSAGHATGGLR